MRLRSFTSACCRWLPIIFGCHGREDRSFFFRGKKLPLCARCCGELVGIVVSLVVGAFWRPHLWVQLVLLLPLVLDGGIQLLTRYESTNVRRLLTGLLFGYGLAALFLEASIAAFWLGYDLVSR